MDIKELKKILEEDYAWGNLDAELNNKWFIDELLEDFLDILEKQLTLTDVSQRSKLLKIPKTTKEQRVQLNEGYNKK